MPKKYPNIFKMLLNGLPVARVPVGPVLPPGRAAAEGEVEGDDEGGEEGAEGDAEVEVGVVGVEAGLVVVGVVVELGALDGREVFEVEG